MLTRLLSLNLFTLFFCSVIFGQQSTCNNWVHLPDKTSFIRVGDLDVTGSQITVEATINRTMPYTGGFLYEGDVVSKHQGPSDINYLLRPSKAQIHTNNGYYETPDICDIELNKTYHVALVYNGKTLKFYRNGFLMSQVNASGNLTQNNWLTQIGYDFHQQPNEYFIGYVNEVRIWNVARTQAEIRQYMNQSLPNPASQIGLLAYYTFDDLKNKQGNSQWDGSILGNAAINQTNPTCSSFIADSCAVKPTKVIASFTGLDTVCSNTPIQFNNRSIGASSYYWSFCTAGFNTTPVAQNLGNPGNLLKTPVFMDYALDDDGNYYGFISNYADGHITKLSYGNSLLNTPTATDLGNFGIIPIFSEGIQVKKVNGKCYVFVVAAGDAAGSASSLFRIDFGSSFANTPTAISLGNVGGLLFPHDLFIVQEGNNFYGFTININDNTITRFDFGSNIENQPTGTNLGNIGKLNYPCGFSFINTNGNWYAFITNRDNNSISRLDFGNSLTNTPAGTNIGNPGNYLNRPRDVSIFQSCEGIVGLVVNEQNEQTGKIIKLDFGSDLLSSPQSSDLGNLGQLKFPHSISKFFLEGNDIYCFITNVENNTITRLRYTGCTSTNIPSSTSQTPPPVNYTEPGIYNVNLLVDIGLPTQTSFCKQIVIKNCDTVCDLKAGFIYEQNTCDPITVQFNDTTSNADSIWWNFGDGKTAGNIKSPAHKYADFGNYTVTLFAKTNAGCFDTAIIKIDISLKKDSAIINNDTSVCAGSSIQLKAIAGLKYCWSPSAGLSDSSIQNPVATVQTTTKYYLNILSANQPLTQDSIVITVVPAPVVSAGKDVSICNGSSVQLSASGANKYNWNASSDLSDTTIANPIATPNSTTQYVVKGYNVQGCVSIDTVKVSVFALPVISLTNNTKICKGDSIMLQANASGNNTYSWIPSTGISKTNVSNPVAYPADTTKYFVTVTDANNCVSTDSVIIDVLAKPVVYTMNDTSLCQGTYVILNTNSTNANVFSWAPTTGLDNSSKQSPQASPASTTTYVVTAGNGVCNEKDSVKLSILSLPVVLVNNDTTVCGNGSAQLIASGANNYTWYPANGLSNTNIYNPMAQPAVTTTYYVAGTDMNGCVNTDSVIVAVQPDPVFNINPVTATVCSGDSTVLKASGGDKYSWSPTQSLTNSTTANTTVFPSLKTTYQVIITNSTCKQSKSLTAVVDIKAPPQISISKSNDVDCNNPEAQLSATGGLSYTWSPRTNINNTQTPNPTVSPVEDTWYKVLVTGNNGCSAEDSILVKSSVANANGNFFVPTAFTPNGDGRNDCFGVKYWGHVDYFQMSVYNRWGQLIFHSENIGTCWDGTINGVQQPIGTYVYQINVSSACSKGTIQRKGTVVLVR